MTTKERLIEILMKILRCRHVKISELQEEFHASRSTIKRDIQELSRHLPIRSVDGRHGGIFLNQDYQLGKKYLTESQTILLEKLSENLTGDDLLTMQSILKTFSKPIQKIG